MRTTRLKICAFLLLCFSIVNANAISPVFKWAKSFGGYDNDYFTSFAIDDADNVYLTGIYMLTMEFGAGNESFDLTSNGKFDFFVAKLDKDGNLLWTKSYGGIFNEYSHKILLDNEGNVYIIGTFNDDVNFGTDENPHELNSSFGQNIFILKLDPDGNFIWVKQLAGQADKHIFSVTYDDAYNLIMTGTFNGEFDFDPGPDEYIVKSEKSYNNFVAKWNQDFEVQWVKQLELDFTSNNTIATDSKNNIYLSGVFKGKVDFDPNLETFYLESGSMYNTYLLKLDASGDFEYAKSLYSEDLNSSFDMVIDSDDNLLLAGYFDGSTDFDPGDNELLKSSRGQRDIFVSKLTSGGELIWVQTWGGAGNEFAQVITTDEFDNIYVAGVFNNSLSFEATGRHDLNTVMGGNSMFNLVMYSNGNIMWTSYVESTNSILPRGILIDSEWNIVTAGYYQGKTDFDPGENKFELEPLLFTDVFVQKVSQTTLSVLESNFGFDIGIFPNPMTDFVTLEFENVFESCEVKIITLTGEEVFSGDYYHSKSIIMNLDVPPGFYLMILESDNKKAVLKLMKN
ncbi:MAG: T9SS type A sorting domain-containing protein [Candidatus Kapabacteria bacterium]|nr:T9SS type A sorting domain-containing protein [Candidatus Kapabacteria bacterium]